MHIYPSCEIQVAKSFHYDISHNNNDDATPKHYTISAQRNGKYVFSITLGEDEISVSLYKTQTFKKHEIKGLPGVSVNIMTSFNGDDTDNRMFILADPHCIEKLLSDIETHMQNSN